MDEEEAVGKIVRAIREMKPQVIFTFGPDGVYGHPDHVTIGQFATKAFRLAGDPVAYSEQIQNGLEPWAPLKLYYVAPPRERYQRMGEYASQLLPDTTWIDRDWTNFGVPEEQITTCVNVGRFIDTKLAAIAAHQTQIMPSHPYSFLPKHILEQFFSEECYVLAESRIGDLKGRENDLFQGVVGVAP